MPFNLKPFGFPTLADATRARAAVDGKSVSPCRGSLLFIINGDGPACGKTRLASAIAAAHGGREMTMQFPRNATDMQRTLNSVLLMSGSQVVIFDNVRKLRAGITQLEAFVSAKKHTFRRIYSREIVTLANKSVVIITGDNLNVPPDLSRRAICISF